VNDPRDRPLGFQDLNDDDLGAALRLAFAFPTAPDLAPSVLSGLGEAMPLRRRRFTWPRLSRGVALALVALVVVGAVAAATILGVPGIRILWTEDLERPEPAFSAPAADVGRVGAALGLGTRMSLDDIRARVEMPVVPPADEALGPPDAVGAKCTLGEREVVRWGCTSPGDRRKLSACLQ